MKISTAEKCICISLLLCYNNLQIYLGVRCVELNYRLPELSDEIMLREYVAEHHSSGERSVTASMGFSALPYEEWVAKMQSAAHTPDAELGRHDMLLCFEKDRLVGLLSVRFELSDEMRAKYGDIGYGVRPTERRKGYATAMLKHALEICREKGMKDAVVGCYVDNVASERTILNNGGVLMEISDAYSKGRTSKYYRIWLDEKEED